MSKSKAKTFKAYREASRNDYCTECGRGYPLATRQEWWDHKASVQRHNEWHDTATPEELARHEQSEAFVQGIYDTMLRSFGEVWQTDTTKGLLHDFSNIAEKE